MGLGSVLRGILSRSGVTGGAGAAAGASRAGAGVGRPSGAWRGLPAIQRAVGPAPLVAPNTVFRARLAAAKPPPTALAPLGHEHGLEAPGGLVTGLAAPVQRAADPVPSSVRRAGRPGRGAVADEGAVSVARLAETVPAESIVYPAFGSGLHEDVAAEPATGTPTTPTTAGTSVASAPVVARRTEAVPLTVARLAEPVPGGHVGAAASAGAASASASHQPASAPSSFATSSSPATVARETASSAAPASQASGTPSLGTSAVPGPASSSGPTPVAGEAVPLVARSADGGRPNLGQSRRLRIGAALSTSAATPLVSTSRPGAADRASTSAPDGPAQRSIQRHAPGRGSSVSGDDAATSPGEPLPASEDRTVSREVTWAVPPSTPEDLVPDPARPAYGGPGVVAREPDAAPVPIRPLVTARSATAPLVGTLKPLLSPASPAVAVHVEREVDDEVVDEPGSPAAALAALARFDQVAGIPGPFEPGGGGAFGAGGGGSASSLFPSSAAAWSSPGGSPASAGRPSALGGSTAFGGPAGLARPVGPAATSAGASATVARSAPVQRSGTAGGPAGSAPRAIARVGSPWPAGATMGPAVQRAMTWDPVRGMTVTALPAAPSASPADAGSASPVTPSAHGGAPDPGSAWPSIAPLVARSMDGADGSTATSVVQREEAAGTAGGDSGTTAGAPGAGATATMPEAQLDDLARRLHDRIAARISRDLLVERERSGSLIDREW